MSNLEYITIRPESDHEEPFNFLLKEDGSLLVHPMPFFSDCFEHTYQGILCIKRSYSTLETFGDPEQLEKEERELYEKFLETTKPALPDNSMKS